MTCTFLMKTKNSPFSLNNMFQSTCHLFIVKRSKSKSCAAWLESWNNLGQVVANQTESCVLCKFLHHWKKKRYHDKGINHKRYHIVVYWETCKLILISILRDHVPLNPKDDDLHHLLIKTDLVFTNYAGTNLAIPLCPLHSNFCLCSSLATCTFTCIFRKAWANSSFF